MDEAPSSSKLTYTKKLACGNCKRSKLKCDRVKPCASCKVRGLHHRCYQDDESHASSGQGVSPASSDAPSSLSDVTKALQNQQKAFSSLLTHLQREGAAQAQPHHHERHWSEEVRESLPSPQDLEVLLEFCATDFNMFDLPLHQSRLIRTFDRLQHRTAVSQVETALLLIVLATSALIIPVMHPLRSRLSSSLTLEEEHRKWVALADKLKSQSGFKIAEQRKRKDVIAEIMLDMGFAIYLSHADREDDEWDVLGAAIRKGAGISLFDERHALWRSLSEEEKVRRRILAVSIVIADTWTAFNRMRLPGISVASLHLNFQETSTCRAGVAPFIGGMDPRQFATIHRCHGFILDFSDKVPASRYSEASILYDEIKSTTKAILSSMGVTLSIDVLPTYMPSVPEHQRTPLLTCVSSSSYLACMITRRFLTDPGAPADLRFASLQHAQNILATVPVVTTFMQEKRVTLNPSWNANHLLCAATAFAVILNGRDEYFDAMALPTLHEAIANETTVASDHGRDDKAASSPFQLIKEQIQWISSQIFDILDCLQVMYASSGNQTTLLCLRMLHGMCRADRHLERAFQRRYSNELAPGQGHQGETSEELASEVSEEVQSLINSVWASAEEAKLFSEIMKY